jgi:hypothetical protein
MSDEDIIRIANKAGWDVQNLDDGFGERLRRFAQDLEYQPLYTAPPKRDLTCVCGAVWEGETMVHPPREREWRGLTDEEIITHFQTNVDTGSLLSFVDGARYAEAKLKEKNHG